MISWISSKLLSFMPIKGWLIGLFVVMAIASFATGKLLINEYRKSGKQSADLEAANEEIKQWQFANNAWSTAWLNREAEIEQAQKRLVALENTRVNINKQVAKQRQEAKEIKDENHVLDVDLGDDFWMHVNKSVEAGNTAYGMPSS